MKSLARSALRSTFLYALPVIAFAILFVYRSLNPTERLRAPSELFQSSTAADASFKAAREGSDGFFDDIRASDWKLLIERTQATPHCKSSCEPEPAEAWYQNNWEPNFTCLHERRIGLWGDGGKWVCDPHRITAKSNAGNGCLVYSIGSNNDFSFEESVLQDISPHCEIHTFDPTVGEYPSNLPTNGNVKFHAWGLAANDDGAYHTLPTMVRELEHYDKEIDILKIDCEGCEWSTYGSWLSKGVRARQIMIELHGSTLGENPVPATKFMEFLSQHGYVIFHKEPNTLGCQDSCIEYSFVRLAIPEDRTVSTKKDR